MFSIPPSIMKVFLSQISSQMKSPSHGLQGQLAMWIMKTFNQASIREAVKRLELKNSDVFVEIGAGHGEALKAMVDLNKDLVRKGGCEGSSASTTSTASMLTSSSIPKRIVLIEISPEFRRELQELLQNEILPTGLFSAADLDPSIDSVASSPIHSESDKLPTIEIQPNDCISMPYLPSNSVNTIFGFNSIYFLHPLETYLTEMKRVLKPGGRVVFGCKFAALPEKGTTAEFINVDRHVICERMTEAGFVDVGTEKVLVDGGENGMKNYVEIVGVNPGTSR